MELPRAIATQDGIPQKGQKSLITKFFEKKYSNAFMQAFPPGWLQQS